MKLRRDVKVAWNLLHLLTKEYVKTNEYVHQLNTKWDMRVTSTYLAQVTQMLSRANLIEIKQSLGIRSTGKRVFLADVARALAITVKLDTSNPAGRAQSRIIDHFELIFMESKNE